MDASRNLCVRECWEMYGTDDSIVTVNKSTEELKSTGLNGCWKKLWCQPAGKIKEHPLVSPLIYRKSITKFGGG
jgi:hypothetical protein